MAGSHLRGADHPPLVTATLGSILEDAARLHGGADALVVPFQGVRWTYAELMRRTDRLARGLAAVGLRPGERLGIWAPNCAEWALTQFAAARAGLVLVNINPAYRAQELRYALDKVQCAGIVTARFHKGSDYLAMLGSIHADLQHLRTVIVIDPGREVTGPGVMNFEDVAQGADALLPADLDHLEPINLQFTSGTTGSPKAATLSHRNIVNNARMVAHRLALSSVDRVCIPVPLYHCFGMVMGNIACVSAGAAMVYPAPSFEATRTLETIAAERCSAVYGVPTMFIAMLQQEDFDRHDLTSLRTGIMAGAPCPMSVMTSVVDRMHVDGITIAYGMTETSPVSFQSDREDDLDRRVSTVGRVQPHLEVELVDERGGVVELGARGEIRTRGYSVMLGYWGEPDRTAEVIDADGWMHTGDLGTVDEDGYLRIVGRLKDMVIRGGENIYPREIEEHLSRHPSVAEAHAFGVADDRLGEELCAWIVLHRGHDLDEDGVRSFCRDGLAHFKVPRHVRFVEAFPMTVTGKVQKFVMREAMEAELAAISERQAGPPGNEVHEGGSGR